MKNILVFGGTFNPVHNGHVRLCRLTAEKIQADLSVIVPAFSPVHKSVGNELASCEHRMNMCKLAFDGVNELVSDIEISTGRPCYTYETLTWLSEIYKDAQLYLACGSDMFLSIHSWRRPDLIFKNAIICGMSRAEQFDVLKRYADEHVADGLQSVLVDVEPYIVSSSEIRHKIADGLPIDDHVPSSVNEYIKRHGLYL